MIKVIDKTRYLTSQQAFKILQSVNANATSKYAQRVLRQLRYMQKICFETDEIVALPRFMGREIDRDMLAAVDVMLDVSGNRPLELAGEKAPFKLRFLTDDGDYVGSYGIILAAPGTEQRVNFQLEEVSEENRTIIILISEIGQRELITATGTHYFAVRDGEKYRYFKGE